MQSYEETTWQRLSMWWCWIYTYGWFMGYCLNTWNKHMDDPSNIWQLYERPLDHKSNLNTWFFDVGFILFQFFFVKKLHRCKWNDSYYLHIYINMLLLSYISTSHESSICHSRLWREWKLVKNQKESIGIYMKLLNCHIVFFFHKADITEARHQRIKYSIEFRAFQIRLLRLLKGLKTSKKESFGIYIFEESKV